MGMKDYIKYFWVLKVCVWCGKHILPEDLVNTKDPEDQNVYFQHDGSCPDEDPLDAMVKRGLASNA
jgi:hypothetical protein